MDNLPGELSSFIGRAVELAEVSALVARERLVTITGAGGSGKTRMALQVARSQIPRLADGVCWVELAPVRQADAVVDVVARVAGVPGETGERALTTLAERLRTRRMLLVLDNCEHLVEPVALLVDEVLRAAPQVQVLATSREPLAVDGEVAWRIPPLPSGDDAASDAVRLFVDRAARARSTFSMSAGDTATVAAICAQLDGMPLAIELAAARCRSMSPPEILAGLQDVFALLQSQRRGPVARLRTLEASIEWSHALLRPPERLLLRRLSVFAGGCTSIDAVGVVADDELSAGDVHDALDRLVAQSMVVLDDGGPGARYRLLETVRQYAARRLEEAGETASFRARHAGWFRDLAHAAGPGLEGPGDVGALRRLAPDVDNLRLAGEWFDAAGEWSTHAEMISACMRLWELVGPTEAARDLSVVLAALEGETSVARARALLVRSRMFAALADFERAIVDAQAALELTEDPAVRGRARFALGLVVALIDVEYADGLFAEARTESEAAGDSHAVTEILVGWEMAWLGFRGDMARGWAIADEATASLRDAPNRVLIATHEAQLAVADVMQGEYERALERVDLAERALSEVAAAVGTDADRVAQSLNIGSPIEFARATALLATLGPTAPLDRLPGVVARAEADGMPGFSVFVGPIVAVWEHVRREDDAADARLDRAIEQAGALGAVTWQSYCQLLRADTARQAGDSARAESLVTAARIDGIAIFCEVRMATTLAAVALSAGRVGDAERLAHEAVALAEPHHFLWELVAAFEVLVRVAAANESWVETARLGGAAARLRGEHGFFLDFEGAQPHVVDALERARVGAGDDAFGAAFGEGQQLDLAAAIAFAQRARGSRGRPRFGWDSLTPTEAAVVEQVESGLGNADIARALLMSTATVKTHLSHVFAKLGVATRTELAAMAVRRRAGLEYTRPASTDRAMLWHLRCRTVQA